MCYFCKELGHKEHYYNAKQQVLKLLERFTEFDEEFENGSQPNEINNLESFNLNSFTESLNKDNILNLHLNCIL